MMGWVYMAKQVLINALKLTIDVVGTNDSISRFVRGRDGKPRNGQPSVTTIPRKKGGLNNQTALS
jgi:hypothetical protein